MKVTLLKNTCLGTVQYNLLVKRIKESLVGSSYIWTDFYSEAEILLFCEVLPEEIPEILPYASFIRSNWKSLYYNSLKVIKTSKRFFLKEVKSFFPSDFKNGPKKILAFLESMKDPIEAFMTSLSLEREAVKRGWSIKIYKKESAFSSFELINKDEINDSDFVISTLKKRDNLFLKGKKLYLTSNKNILKAPSSLMDKMLYDFKIFDNLSFFNLDTEELKNKTKDSLLKNILTGFYFVLPMIILGSFFSTLSYVVRFFYSDNFVSNFLNYMGNDASSLFIIPLLSAFISFSIADRTAIFAGILGGFLANELNLGFAGGIASGFLAGYIVRFLIKRLTFRGYLDVLNSFFLIPFLSSLIVGFIFIFVITPPFSFFVNFINEKIFLLEKIHPFLFGSFLGAITASDLGGIMTKSSYVFGLGLLSAGDYAPISAIVAGGMVPPLSMGIVVWLDDFLKREVYGKVDKRAGAISFILGIFSITEGALPIAIKDLPKAIFASIVGGGVAGGLSILSTSFLTETKGGILVLFSFNSLLGLIFFLLCVICGSMLTAIVFSFFKLNKLKKIFLLR